MEQMGLSKDGADRAKMFIRHFSAEEVFEAPKLARGFVEANYSKGLHTQGFYEVNTVLRGSAVHCVGKRSITVSCGDTFIIPPNVPHSYDGGEGFDVYHLLLSPKFLERNFSELRLLPAFSALFRIDPMLREKTSSRLHFRLDGSELDFLSPMLDTLTRYSAQKSTESAIITNCQAMIVVAELCSAYEKKNADRALRDDDDDGFTRSIQYIYENYRQHISIEELTRIARMSRTAYMVRFKRVTGVTPGKFQSNYRVELAKQMLSDTSAHISEIAADVGCFDASHFVRIFSAQCGVTPGEYRQRLKNNG